MSPRHAFSAIILAMTLLVPSAGHASFIPVGPVTLVEVDPAPTFTPVTLQPIEVNVPGIGGRVTFELGNEIAPPPAELGHTYDMRVRIENYGTSASNIHAVTLTGFSSIPTSTTDLQGHSDAPSPTDLIVVVREDADTIRIDLDFFFPELALGPGETGWDIYFRFNTPVSPLSTFHVSEVNDIPVAPELAVQRVPEPSFEPIARWTTHRISSDGLGTPPLMFDGFTSPTNDILNTVRFHGMYVDQDVLANNPASAPNTDRFEVTVWTGDGVNPASFAVLHTETVSMSVVTTTFLGNFEANGVGSGTTYPFYEFEIPLYTGFSMARDTEYWLSVQSITDGAYQPVLNWIDADVGQSLGEDSIQWFGGIMNVRPDDRAFEIEAPEPGFAVGLLAGLGFLGAGARRRRTRR